MSRDGRKRGKLSNDEMKYIRENCMDLSLEEMAQFMNRTIEPIKKYIDKQNLKARDLSDEEHLLAMLRSRYYYNGLRNQFDDGEIIFFEHQWIDYFKQFGEDVIHSEEMQILELIRTEILIKRSMEDRQQIVRQIANTERMLDEMMEEPPEERDGALIATLTTQLGSLMGSKGSYINEHEKLVTKKERYLKDIKGTREQRKRVADDAKTNFTMWMRQLDKLEEREKQGLEMEVHAIAANKARDRLAELHEYEDGEVDQPLLNSDTIIEEED